MTLNICKSTLSSDHDFQVILSKIARNRSRRARVLRSFGKNKAKNPSRR